MNDDVYRGEMVHAVKSLYDNVKYTVKANDVITPFLGVTPVANMGVDFCLPYLQFVSMIRQRKPTF